MSPLVVSLLISLALTEALEIPFCTAAWRFGPRDIGVCALANVATNPPVVFMHYLIRQWLGANGAAKYLPVAVLILELAAVIAEWLIYSRCTDKKHPFLISLTANAFSYFAGLAVSMLINR